MTVNASGPGPFLTFVKRYGSAARFAAETVLPYLLPPPMAKLCNDLIGLAHESACDEFDIQGARAGGLDVSAEDFARIESVLGVVNERMETLVLTVSRLEHLPEVAQQILETHLESDARCLEALGEIHTITADGFEQVETRHREILDGIGLSLEMQGDMLLLLKRVESIVPFIEELRGAQIGNGTFGERLRQFRDSGRALLEGDPDAARTGFAQLRDAQPDSAAVHVGLASAQAVQQQWREVDDALEQAVQLRPDDGDLVALRDRVTRATRTLSRGPSPRSEFVLEVGQVVGRAWTLEELLGRGGMGQVWRARRDNGEVVALKVIHPELSTDPRFEERFEAEIQAMHWLGDHPNLATVRHHWFDRGLDCFYFTMDLIAGVKLETRLRRGDLSKDDRIQIILLAAEGLAHAHSRGVVHGDVTPTNILVRDADNAAVVIDFGLARLGSEPAEAGGYSSQFAAPEQLRWGRCDARTDVYGLAATCYHALAYDHEDSRQVDHFDPDLVDARFRDLLRRSLANNPKTRPESAVEFRDACLEALQTSETKPRPLQQPSTPESQPTPVPPPLPSEPTSRPNAVPPPLPSEATSTSQPHAGMVPPPLPSEAIWFDDGIQAGQVWSDNSLEIPFCWCPPGTFLMGSPEDEPDRRDDEFPHQVTLTQGFWLGQFPVTQAEYEAVMGTNPSKFSPSGFGKEKVRRFSTDRFPVESVSWEEAVDFCRRLTERDRNSGWLPSDWTYGLPTEAQWEYACRAGTTTAMAFGIRLGSHEANCDGNLPYNGAEKGPNLDRPTPVGSYAPNRWGLFDMHGNVREWCWDWYGREYYAHSPESDPQGARTGTKRVARGGSWFGFARNARSAYRDWAWPLERSARLGFRLAVVQADN